MLRDLQGVLHVYLSDISMRHLLPHLPAMGI